MFAAWFAAVVAPVITDFSEPVLNIPDGIGEVELAVLATSEATELWLYRDEAGMFGGVVRVLTPGSEVCPLSIPNGQSLNINLVTS